MSAASPGLDAGREALRRFLAGEDDLTAMFTAIARIATDVVPGCDRASISMMLEGRPGTTVSTDDTARVLDEIQRVLDDGPYLAAMRRGEMERVDIATESRWPEFVATAKRNGVVGVIAAPLRSEAAWGCLNLYTTTRGAFDEQAAEIALLFGDQLGMPAINAAAHADGFQLSRDLRRAMESRAVIEQAERVVLAQSDVVADDEAGRSLDTARRALRLTQEQLWVSYFGLGGTAPRDQLIAHLEGVATMSRAEHNVVVHALNEEFVDLGQLPPVPYIESLS